MFAERIVLPAVGANVLMRLHLRSPFSRIYPQEVYEYDFRKSMAVVSQEIDSSRQIEQSMFMM